jgi:hypothetical protein
MSETGHIPDIVPSRTSSVPPERLAPARGRQGPASPRSTSLAESSWSEQESASEAAGVMLIPKIGLGRGGSHGTARWGGVGLSSGGSMEMSSFSVVPEGLDAPSGSPLEVLRYYEQAVLDTASDVPAVSESLSEVLLNGSSMGSISRGSMVANRAMTEGSVGRWEWCPRLGPELPPAVVERLLGYMDHESYLALRLTCRAWFDCISRTSPVKLPAVFHLPPEIIQHIYGFLAPADFNSARHTSRAWLAASLDKPLLLMMLRRGGWLGGVVDHSGGGYLSDVQESQRIKMSEEWWLSKCLSRECSLGPDWRGDGLPRSRPSRSSRLSPPPLGRDRRRGARSTSLEMTSVTDFSEIVSNYSEAEDVPGSSVHFTVSVCGRYVMVAEGCVVYVYRLSGQNCQGVVSEGSLGGCLSPVTSVLCPRRVLAVSMDTSCGRFAIAALLDGRMGLVCDIANSIITHDPAAIAAGAVAEDMTVLGTGGSGSSNSNSSNSSAAHLNSRANGRIAHDGFAFTESELAEINELEGSSRVWAATANDSARLAVIPGAMPEEHDVETAAWPPPNPPPCGANTIPVEAGPSTVYRNVCSVDDPPISVAICPQRKCVGEFPPFLFLLFF